MTALGILLWIVSVNCFAQTSITAAEYFFDTDPGVGNAIPVAVTAADTVSANLSIPVSSLSNGRHLFCFRTKDNLGNWSHASITQITVEPKGTQLNKAEYFFDTDPGIGNGNSITLPVADSVLGNFSLPVSGLSNGRHLFCLRTKDNAGNWGHPGSSMILVEPRGTVLVKGEYYLDADPGIGNGSPINFTSIDTINSNLALALPAVALGLHNLCVRVKDDAGNWNFQTCTSFQVVPRNDACTDAEYYFDTDPGVGNGTRLNLNLSQDTIDLNSMNVLVPLSMPVGTHYLFIRAKNNGNVFSLAEIDTFDVTFNPLPVSLLNFDVYKINQQALLQWSTAQEQNNRGFEIQYSSNGVDFFAVGFVAGNGTVSQQSRYQFIHTSPLKGKNFYRLKQVDLDNHFKLSAIRRLDFNIDAKPVAAPNPFTSEISLYNIDNNTSYRIINPQGQIVMKGIVINNKINTNNLAAGVYMLELTGNNGPQLIRLVKE